MVMNLFEFMYFSIDVVIVTHAEVNVFVYYNCISEDYLLFYNSYCFFFFLK